MAGLVILGIVLVLWAAWLAQAYHKRVSAARAKPAVSPLPVESWSAILRRIAQPLADAAQKTAHPSDILELADFNTAVAAMKDPEVSLDRLREYALGANWALACAAFVALSERPDRETLRGAVLTHFSKLWPWPIHFALIYLDGLPHPPPAGAPLAFTQPWWINNGVLPSVFAASFARRAQANEAPSFGGYLTTSRANPDDIDAMLQSIAHPFAHALHDELRHWLATRIDRHFLSSIGRLWEGEESYAMLIEPPAWDAALNLAETAVLHSPPRSIVVSGEARTGKTSFLLCLGRRLARSGWTVFDAGGAELMAGQSYFGELEGRIRRLVTELDSARRIVWYVPDLLQIAESGTHRGQSASILDQIAPAIASGRLIIMAEASPAGVSRLLQRRPSLRSVIDVCRLDPMDEAQTAALAGDLAKLVAKDTDFTIGADAVSATLQLGQHYLGVNGLPGTALDLLKRSIERARAAGETELSSDGVLATLSQISGLPLSILDDRQRIDLASVRRFFAERVMGQDEAIDAVTDRIAMLKAGLVDPKRPIGVFLFAGPTGTGKTELAKTLAEFLFGSPDRMARLDMSEFQTADSTVKILGERGYVDHSDSLVERIRKQPFSVVLLDEFEKAHANVWDLFLQLFDDGRLTDANGRTADFRYCFIILTSNLGAAGHRGSRLGFVPPAGADSEDPVIASVAQTFRPEFVNRLDKIIVFRPLSRQLMRSILHKELQLVLERRGLRDRDWAVEWEDSAIEFLLDRGFSSEMGARPLKRAVDQYLLAPLAKTLVEHRFPEGDQFLFVRSDGHAIQVEFVDPDMETEPAPTPAAPDAVTSGVSLATMILQPEGTERERNVLTATWSNIEAQLASADWNRLKERLYADAAKPDIWSRPDRGVLFSRVALIDRVAEAARTAERLCNRIGGRTGSVSREVVARAALQHYLVEQGIADVLDGSPVDALVGIEPLFDTAIDEAACRVWCDRLKAMYAGWAARRHMQLAEIAVDEAWASVSLIGGFGAYRTLAGEAGLHVWEDGDGGGRIAARVRVAAGPAEEPSRTNRSRICAEMLAATDASNAIVRRYRGNPAPLVRDAKRGWRSGRLDIVLGGDFDLVGVKDMAGSPGLARQA